jgi:hypothetical protein
MKLATSILGITVYKYLVISMPNTFARQTALLIF